MTKNLFRWYIYYIWLSSVEIVIFLFYGNAQKAVVEIVIGIFE